MVKVDVANSTSKKKAWTPIYEWYVVGEDLRTYTKIT